ncbi:MAG: type VI secretion system tube protein Hcp [Azoarcus sp.]|jgi:type VI secretion system secreted protein Hcp|nr:type VI secretion system tube protein Hcp [Azoarcus sp.]
MSEQAIYVKIDGIEGESQEAKHKGWIEAETFSYSVSNSSSASVGGGSGVGRASFDVLQFTHAIDKTSPVLFKYCALGKHIPKVQVSVCKSSGNEKLGAIEFMNVTLEDVIITYVSPNGSNASSQVPESISMSYAKILVKVKEQNKDGSLGKEVEAGWDVKQNQAA